MNKITTKILIATGGTGGHIFPALSLAKHLINIKKLEVELTSDARGLKYFKDKDLKINKVLATTIDKKNIFKLIFSMFTIFYSIILAIILLYKKKPSLVFGMGGYSSFPICIASKLIGIPFILYENNLHIGKANKYLLPFSKKIFVSFDELSGISDKYKYKINKIGNIIRKNIINLKSTSFKKDNNKFKFLILGGSQAAKVFAEKLPNIFKKCIESKIPLEIYQQCLPSQSEFLESFYKNLKIDYKIFHFSDDISEYLLRSNFAITRSGSSMLSELVNVRIPFISIPLPSSADNHQLKNAVFYEKKGFCFLIEEKNLEKDLFKIIEKIHEDGSLIDTMVDKQRQHSDKSVYENIDQQLIEIMNEKY